MKRKIFIWLGILLAIGLLILTYFIVGSYSDGVRNGHIVKISHKGVIFKTWEGQIHLDCSRVGSNPMPWDFSVPDDKIANEIQQASLENSCVNLHYKEKFFKFSWLGDTKYYVYKVERVNTTPPHFGQPTQ